MLKGIEQPVQLYRVLRPVQACQALSAFARRAMARSRWSARLNAHA
jgi:hypothetical protein